MPDPKTDCKIMKHERKKLKGRGGPGRGQGRPFGATKPDKEKRVRCPMTTIKPENKACLERLKAEGFNLGRVYDQMIEAYMIKFDAVVESISK